MKKNEAIKTLLNVWRSRLGLGEDPDGSNHNMITAWYNENVEHIGDGPWCEMTHAWATYTAGLEILQKARAYTPYAAGDAQKGTRGMSWHLGTKGMMAGDKTYYDWDGNSSKSVGEVDHTGIVEHIYDDGTFDVLEGNTGSAQGGMLKRVRRNSKYVTGYVRYDWTKVLEKDDPAPFPHPSPAPVKLQIDGKLGLLTIKALQRALKTPVDGVIDAKNSDLVIALQKFLKDRVDHRLKVTGEGLTQDGSRSETVGALQRYLKSPVDLRIDKDDSLVVRALQRRLNTGRF